MGLPIDHCFNKHLDSKGVVEDPTCRICGEGEEDVLGECLGLGSTRLRYLRAQALNPERMKQCAVNIVLMFIEDTKLVDKPNLSGDAVTR